LSRSPSLSSTPARETPANERARARRRFRPFRLFIFLLIIAVAALFEPNTFRFVAGQCIRLEAWRRGVSVQIGSMDGSLLEPVVLRNSVWIYESNTGPVTRVEIAAATAEFSWRNLLPRSTGRWFQRLTIAGLTGKIQFPLEAAERPSRAPSFSFHFPRPRGRWMPAPERIEASGVDFIFQSNSDYVRLADTDFTLSHVEAGTIHAGQLAIKQPWLARTFHDVRGATAIQDTKVEVANLTLAPDVQLRDLSAELDDLARGELNLSLWLDAFGGDIRVDAGTITSVRPFSFEATVFFKQISIGKLANFLLVSDAAGGTIKQGKFTFRGPPQQLHKATASLRLEATNFQWDSRQWDALVLGASLMEGRVQVPELSLAQGHNRLNLSGEMPLPTPGVAWWQSEFNVNIAAKIDNLTELSALMMPEFQYAAGKANIDGSIRGKDQQFNGQLIVSGSNLKWHNAPIEELHAGVKLNGNEFQLTNVSLFNNGDYLRGHGVVNIIGDKQYWGEIHASIEDLDKYAALLEKPIVPEPLAGGAVIDWSGEGSAKGHSGNFSAKLRKLRSLGTTAALLHPINADLAGTYAPGTMLFSRFTLSDDDSSFTANVGVGNKALSLHGIKLYSHQALALEGDALLPFDVWNAWPNTTFAKLLDDQTVTKVNLTAYNLGLHEASLLTGFKFPIEGVVLGNIVAEGPLNGLKTSGKITLNKGQIPLGWSGEMLTKVEGEAALDGQTLTVKKFSGQHAGGDFAASGQVSLANARDPALQLLVATQKSTVKLFQGRENFASAIIRGAADVSGTAGHPKLSGNLNIDSLSLRARDPVQWLYPELPASGAIPDAPSKPLPPLFQWADGLMAGWELALNLSAEPAPSTKWNYGPLQGSGLQVALQLTGTVASPQLVGEVNLEGGPAPALTDSGRGMYYPDFDLYHPTAPLIERVQFGFREGFPRDSSILGVAAGWAYGEPYELLVTGTLHYPMRTILCAPPLTEKLVLRSISGAPPFEGSLPDSKFSLTTLPEFTEGVPVVAWPAIATPSPEAAPPAPNPAAPPAAATPPPAGTPAPAAPPKPAATPSPAAATPAPPAAPPAATPPGPSAPPPPAIPAPASITPAPVIAPPAATAPPASTTPPAAATPPAATTPPPAATPPSPAPGAAK
jgi:hypothetical protein